MAVRWVELQRFYMMLMTGKVITRSRLVGIPFRDLLRTRFAYLVLAAKEEVSSGLGYTAEQLAKWLNKGLEGRQAEAEAAPAGSQSGMLAVIRLRPGQEQGRG